MSSAATVPTGSAERDTPASPFDKATMANR